MTDEGAPRKPVVEGILLDRQGRRIHANSKWTFFKSWKFAAVALPLIPFAAMTLLVIGPIALLVIAINGKLIFKKMKMDGSFTGFTR